MNEQRVIKHNIWRLALKDGRRATQHTYQALTIAEFAKLLPKLFIAPNVERFEPYQVKK